MLDVRKLRLLRELEARGTVSAVAEALAYSPSAVSQQLAALQREAGVALTERVGRRLVLTDAGERLVRHADVLLDQLEAAEAELQEAAGQVRGRIRLAALQTPLLSIVPVALRRLAAAYPELRLELTEAEPEESLPALALGELDIAVAEENDGSPRETLPGLEREPLLRDRIVVALPTGHRLARRKGPVDIAELAGDAWATAKPDTEFAGSFMRACRLRGFEPDVRHRANDVAILRELVATGTAVALLPELALPRHLPGIVVRPTEPSYARTVYAFHRRGARARPALRATVEALRDAAGE